LQFKIHPACALLGPRQVGKTTLARLFSSQHANKKFRFFDLGNPIDLARLENPMLALAAAVTAAFWVFLKKA
jgi:predicted AAA+ superfamily ATPase